MHININRYRSYVVTMLMSIAPVSPSLAIAKHGGSVAAAALGVEDYGTGLVVWFNNPYGWTDLHYKLNDAGLETVRLASVGDNRKESIIPVQVSGPVKLVYSFTHATATGATSTVDYTFERLSNSYES